MSKPGLRHSLFCALKPIASRRVAKMAQRSPTTIRRYRRVLSAYNLTWETITDMDDESLLAIFCPKKGQVSVNKRMPDWNDIHARMQKRYMTLMQVWSEYREASPEDAYGYKQFTYLYRRFQKSLGVSMRQTHFGGEATYVDFAGNKELFWTDVETGEKHHPDWFIAVMAASNHTFSQFSGTQSLSDWIETHNRMIEFFGGSSQVIVPDNLRSAVSRTKPDHIVNRTYAEWATHCGTMILPTRVRKPKDKAKAEGAVLIFYRWALPILRNRQFFSLEEMNAALNELLVDFSNRKFQKLKGTRQSRFEEIDKPLLIPLPSQRFEFTTWLAERKVGPDYHLEFEGHAYSVPYELVGKFVEGRVTRSTVEFLYKHKVIALHPRSNVVEGHTTNPAHQPAKHRMYAQRTLEGYSKWARTVGISAMEVMARQFKGKPDYSLRAKNACDKLQKLARLYGVERFEAACQKALALDSPSFTSVLSILQCNLDATSPEREPVQISLPFHHNVRGPEYYQQRGLNS